MRVRGHGEGAEAKTVQNQRKEKRKQKGTFAIKQSTLAEVWTFSVNHPRVSRWFVFHLQYLGKEAAVTLLQLYPRHSREENTWSQLCLSALAGAVGLGVQARRNPEARAAHESLFCCEQCGASVLPQHAHAPRMRR